jgi:outer membrane biosynthesis protein TonB
MIKWFAYIVLLLIMAPAFSSAKDRKDRHNVDYLILNIVADSRIATDTAATKNTKHPQEQDDKKKVKEIRKAKRQPKPEKIVPADAPAAQKPKPKRERRPEGLERPPEIPRRNGGG